MRLWYRPPAPGNISSISTLESELSLLRNDVIGTIIVGDLNCHHARWLYHSSSVTTEGCALQRFCMESGFQQIVRGPTRGEYLLDLVLTDMADSASAQILPKISDHKCVLARLHFSLDVHLTPPRTVWNYRSADWASLKDFLSSVDYSFIDVDHVDIATQKLTDILLSAADRFISKRILDVEASSHPWITPACRTAVLDKHAASGTAAYAEKCLACSQILQVEFSK